MAACQCGTTEFEEIAAGAARLASGAGGSDCEAIGIIQALSRQCSDSVITMMGSPDSATTHSLTKMRHFILNTVLAVGNTYQSPSMESAILNASIASQTISLIKVDAGALPYPER